MYLLILSYLAGVLTVAAPCILPLLPVILGGSMLEVKSKNKWPRPLIITISLAISVLIFTLLLKASTVLLSVPQYIWNFISGGIVLSVGLGILYPHLWEIISTKIGLQKKSSLFMSKSATYKSSFKRDILLGISLGPVFSSCSPTFAFILAVVIPESWVRGFSYLLFYVLGLTGTLLLIAYVGSAVTTKLNWLSNPNGLLKRIIGVLFIIVGLAVLTGLDKDLQSYIIKNGWYGPVEKIELNLRR